MQDNIEIDFINKLILEKGPLFVEQKFFNIVQTINKATKRSLGPNEVYSKIFPNLTPTITGIEKVFENCFYSQFTPLFHPSEYLYRQWLINFNTCKLVTRADATITINSQACRESLEEFRTWVLEYPIKNGSLINNHIKRELGKLSLNVPTKYFPKNPSVKESILKQLEDKDIIQFSTIDDIKNKVEISLENGDIILTRKKRYPITAEILQLWLCHFGITVSLVTMTYLMEFGMPYGGNVISLNEILRYTNNGYGVIGILAFQLAFLLNLHEANQSIELKFHPLSQSVVLGLARLEYYLNPKIACL